MFVIVTLVARLKHDGLLTVRTDGDDADARLQLVLKELDVILEGLWELIRRCELRHIRLPSRQFLVDGLHIVNLIRKSLVTVPSGNLYATQALMVSKPSSTSLFIMINSVTPSTMML